MRPCPAQKSGWRCHLRPPFEQEDSLLEQEPIRVLLVDDHPVFREGLARLLRAEDGLEVVGLACDGCEATDLAEELKPDVILMDIDMPKLGGLDAYKSIRERQGVANVIFLTVSTESRLVSEARAAGASGYMLKDAHIDEIVQGIRAVHAGKQLYSSGVADSLLRELNQRADADRAIAGCNLTPREVEVLKLISRAVTNRQIADELFISERTVKNHVGSILHKLGVANRSEAILYAIRFGINSE